MNQQQEQFDPDLTEALAADDVVAALDELSRRYADDSQTGERVRSARKVVDDLVRMGERLADKPTPAMPKLDLPARRIRPWWFAIPAAAAAAAVILSVCLTGPTKTDNDLQLGITISPPPPTESVWLTTMSGAADFTLPVMNNPSCPSLEMPAITTLTVGGCSDKEFSTPAFTWPEMVERSTNNET